MFLLINARLRHSCGAARLLLLFLACFLTLPAQASDFPDVQLPDSMKVKVVTNGMRMNGLMTRVYAFRTSQSADELAIWFNDQWNRMARSQFGRWDILSHREGDYLITVQMQKHNLQGVGGYIAFTDVFAAVESGRQPPEVDLPMLPGTHVIQNLRADDWGRESHTLVLTSDQSANQNLEFYRAYFRSEGFEPISKGALAKGSSGGVMILNRGSVQLNLAAIENKGHSIITIVKVWQ